MKNLFSRSLLNYAIALLIIIILAGGILSLVTTNQIVLISVLLMIGIIFVVMLLNIHDRFIVPVEKTIDTVNELVQGNYRARIHHYTHGSAATLMSQINTLARTLNELSLHEQIQAEQLSTVIDHSESGLILVDDKGYIHLVNRKFTSIFGKSPKDYVGYLYYDVLNYEQIHQTIRQTFLYEKNIKDFFTHEDGDFTYYFEIVGAPIFNEQNVLRGAVLVLYDITELKKLEIVRKDFVANISHELKTPITSIKGFAETLLDGAMEEEKSLQEFLTIIYEESEKLQFLIEDLLTLSKLEQDSFRLNITRLPMKNVIEEIQPIIQFKADEKEIDFLIEAEKFPQIRADEQKIKQVLMNLLTNAINYTRNRGKVTLKITENEENVIVEVTDTGIGIEKQYLPRIFERFYRVDKDRSRNTGGTGLGLAIVKHIVDLHKGSIDVESDFGKGSTFRVMLPKNL